MSKKTKALIALALGSISVYLLLKAKEAQAIEKKPEEKLSPTYTAPVTVVKGNPKGQKGFDIDLNNGTIKYKNDGKVNLDISWIVEKFPVLKQLKFEALPYQYENVYH